MKMNDVRALGMMVLALMVFTASPVKAQPDKIVIDHSKILGKSKRPAVMLPHNRHVEAGLSCKDCHHIYQDGKNVLDESTLEEGNQGIQCSACHGPNFQLNLQQVFHDQCMGCHMKLRKEKKKSGPRYCGECHVKK